MGTSILLNSDTSGIGADDALDQDDLSSYCRVDFLQPDKPKKPSGRPENIVWFCSQCGDGPYGFWQKVCQYCSHVICGSCEKEEIY
jgi:hypothetical protein